VYKRQAKYSSIHEVVEFRIDTTAFTATVIIKSKAEGVKSLEQRITLHTDSPVIDLAADFVKLDNATPEAIYFTFPMNLEVGWRGYYDTGDIPAELDAEQLKGTCRDWVTVSSFAEINDAENGAALFCPDAPLVMFGNFNFGRNQASIPRNRNPLLLAWATNNYWETNFRGSQPGLIQLKYAFTTEKEYNAASVALQAQQVISSPIVYQAVNCPETSSGKFLSLKAEGVKIVYVKPAENNHGIIVRLLNLNEKEVEAELELPGKQISSAWNCNTQESNTSWLYVKNSKFKIILKPRQITSLRIE
jgi:hypothetical protein